MKCYYGTTRVAVFLRATACNASRVLAIVEVSVRPSVTLFICITTVQARITKYLLWDALRTLVFL